MWLASDVTPLRYGIRYNAAPAVIPAPAATRRTRPPGRNCSLARWNAAANEAVWVRWSSSTMILVSGYPIWAESAARNPLCAGAATIASMSSRVSADARRHVSAACAAAFANSSSETLTSRSEAHFGHRGVRLWR